MLVIDVCHHIVCVCSLAADVYGQLASIVQVLPPEWRDRYGEFPASVLAGMMEGDGDGASQHTMSPTSAANVTVKPGLNPAYETFVRWHKDDVAGLRHRRQHGSDNSPASGRLPKANAPIRVLVSAEATQDNWVLQRQQQQRQQRQGGSGGSMGSESDAENRREVVVNSDAGASRGRTSFSRTTSSKGLPTGADDSFRGSVLDIDDNEGGGSRDVWVSAVNMSGDPVPTTPPVDQLVSALLDGDAVGVRAAVEAQCDNRSSSSSGGSGREHGRIGKGDSLQSNYWHHITRSVLPLHRAISGLHFHGSESRLVHTLDTLAQLGADMDEVDQNGNTALHKAIQVCSSKNVAAVVKRLIASGCDVNRRNREGNLPLHDECSRWVAQYSASTMYAMLCNTTHG